jgi:hypothetical protein
MTGAIDTKLVETIDPGEVFPNTDYMARSTRFDGTVVR